MRYSKVCFFIFLFTALLSTVSFPASAYDPATPYLIIGDGSGGGGGGGGIGSAGGAIAICWCEVKQ